MLAAAWQLFYSDFFGSQSFVFHNLPGAFAQAVFFAIERIAKQERPSRNRQRGLRAAFAQGVIFAIEAVGTPPTMSKQLSGRLKILQERYLSLS